MNNYRRVACSDAMNIISSLAKVRTTHGRCLGTASSIRRVQAIGREDPQRSTGEKPRLTALDLARKIRQENSKTQTEADPPLSAQQKRVMELKRFSLQLQHVHPNVLAKHLHRSVLYKDQDVVVINKPYGVPVRDDCGGTSICSVLPVLSKLMEGSKIKCSSKLLPSLGLEKETPGALLLARSEAVVEHILDLNRNNQIQKKYWVITVGVPVPSIGVIDIPIIEREVTGSRPHYKMTLSPVFRMKDSGGGVTKVRAHRQAHPAVTKYRVLNSSSGCSLVELQPLTSVKHQMRVHMALALACPILGDHKYSHWNKLAPQKLSEHILGKLGLEQSKARHLPLHLLARQLTLPGSSGADINVSCPLPKYLAQTLQRLQLTSPDNKD
ncbi:pseudouridylate synthase RPUSD4, mitochondrial-like [Brachionichthys hirsutus]|uniref:pseudouridylate synthase RPUSD4, mitochondrial-like n=1 Tax=Brachionichthys hirsutus TaxID=412623 RepID=UPI0036052CE6